MRGKVTILVAIPFLAITGCEVECPPGTISVEKRCLAPDAGDGSVSDGSPGGDAGTGNGTGDAQTPGDASGPPQLTSLEVSAGELDPPFDPAVHEYRVEVPIWISVLSFKPTADGDRSISVNGADTQDQNWSEPIAISETTEVVIDVENDENVVRSYRVSVARRETRDTELTLSSVVGGLAISRSGTTLAVGAPFDSGDAGNPDSDALPGSGAVHVFERNEDRWEPAEYLKAPGAAQAQYLGHHLALSADGQTLAVSAYRATVESGDPSRSSAVHIFRSVGGVWNRTELIHDPSLDADEEITDLSFTHDGTRLAVVAALSGTRRTPVFRWTGSTWATETTVDQRAWISGDGRTIATWDDTLIRLEGRDGGLWSPSTAAPISITATGSSAFDIAMSDDGTVVAVGLPAFNDDDGRLSSYQRANEAWRASAILNDQFPDGRFGYSVELTNRGMTLVASVPGAAYQHTYNWEAETWALTESLPIGTVPTPRHIGTSALAVSVDGTAMVSRSSLTTVLARHLD